MFSTCLYVASSQFDKNLMRIWFAMVRILLSFPLLLQIALVGSGYPESDCGGWIRDRHMAIKAILSTLWCTVNCEQ